MSEESEVAEGEEGSDDGCWGFDGWDGGCCGWGSRLAGCANSVSILGSGEGGGDVGVGDGADGVDDVEGVVGVVVDGIEVGVGEEIGALFFVTSVVVVFILVSVFILSSAIKNPYHIYLGAPSGG